MPSSGAIMGKWQIMFQAVWVIWHRKEHGKGIYGLSCAHMRAGTANRRDIWQCLFTASCKTGVLPACMEAVFS